VITVNKDTSNIRTNTSFLKNGFTEPDNLLIYQNILLTIDLHHHIPRGFSAKNPLLFSLQIGKYCPYFLLIPFDENIAQNAVFLLKVNH